MIEKISVSVDKKQYSPQNSFKQPSFGNFWQAVGDTAIKAIQACEKEPMLNVTFLDLSTAIIPRSILETVVVPKDTDENGKKKKKLNFYAGFEALRRESSGLLVNCILPGFIVMGVSKLLKKPILKGEYSKSNFSSNWSNIEALKEIETQFTKSDSALAIDKRIHQTFKNMLSSLEGLDGNEIKSFDNFISSESMDEFAQKLTKLVTDEKLSKKDFKKVYQEIAEKTHITENIRFKNREGKYFSGNLHTLLDDTIRTLRNVHKEKITGNAAFADFIKKSAKMVNAKSLAGLGIIIPLAISMQPINRWITRKMSGIKGAPMSADFQNKQDSVLTTQDKAALLKQKFISIGSMLGVALLSMMKVPSLNNLKEIIQFKGTFPSMDQARLISAATFASRMAAAEDKNELAESTIRDIATFSSFYFLGDYAAKAIASGMELYSERKAAKYGDNSMKISLLNRKKILDAKSPMLKKFWNWIKNTSLKSSDEMITTAGKRLRSYCQLGNLAFSLLSLGLFIPLYTRTQLNKKEQKKFAKSVAEKFAGTTDTSEGASPGSGNSTVFGQKFVQTSPVFKAIINS